MAFLVNLFLPKLRNLSLDYAIFKVNIIAVKTHLGCNKNFSYCWSYWYRNG